MLVVAAFITASISTFLMLFASAPTIQKINRLKNKQQISTATRETAREEAGVIVWAYYRLYESLYEKFYKAPEINDLEFFDISEYKAFFWSQFALSVGWFVFWLLIFWLL